VDEDYPGVSLVQYERLVYLIVQNPLPGTWLLQAFGADVPEGILHYDAIVSVRERIGPPPVNTGVIFLFVGLAALVGFVVVLIATQQRRPPRLAPVGVQVVSGQAVCPFVTPRRGQLTIGRDPRCEMVLPDPQVSTRHAMIQQTPQGYVLTDLGSKNGTFVNDQRVQQALLRGGERLRIGQTELVFTAAGMPVAPAPVPQPPVGSATAFLAVMAGEQEFARYPVTSGTVLGRYAGCPVDLNADALVSRQHARLDYQAGQWIITDMGSGNGTFVNGQQVRQQALRHGDEAQADVDALQFIRSAGILVLAARGPGCDIPQQSLIKIARLSEADGVDAGTGGPGLLHWAGQNPLPWEPLVRLPVAEQDDDLLPTVWGREESLVGDLEPSADVGAVERGQTIHRSTSGVVIGRQSQVEGGVGGESGNGYLVIARTNLALLLDHVDDVSSGVLGRFDLDAATPGIRHAARDIYQEDCSGSGSSNLLAKGPGIDE
jgi:pSer/pThr/pTyr-binding forkhead associated (FHA) protein